MTTSTKALEDALLELVNALRDWWTSTVCRLLPDGRANQTYDPTLDKLAGYGWDLVRTLPESETKISRCFWEGLPDMRRVVRDLICGFVHSAGTEVGTEQSSLCLRLAHRFVSAHPEIVALAKLELLAWRNRNG